MQHRFLRKRGAAGIPLLSSPAAMTHSPFCRYATSSPGRGKSVLKGTAFGSGGKVFGIAQRRPLGGAGERSEPEGVAFGSGGKVSGYAPSLEKAPLENPQIFQRCKHKNILSAIYAQSERGAHSKSFSPFNLRTKPPRVCPPGALLCCNREMKVLLFGLLKPLAVPCIRFDPWAGLASCRPLRQKFLPVSAAGCGRNFSP